MPIGCDSSPLGSKILFSFSHALIRTRFLFNILTLSPSLSLFHLIYTNLSHVPFFILSLPFARYICTLRTYHIFTFSRNFNIQHTRIVHLSFKILAIIAVAIHQPFFAFNIEKTWNFRLANRVLPESTSFQRRSQPEQNFHRKYALNFLLYLTL